MRVTRLLLIALAVTAVVATAVMWGAGQVRIDRCLDAGGAWDAKRKTCVGARIGT